MKWAEKAASRSPSCLRLGGEGPGAAGVTPGPHQIWLLITKFIPAAIRTLPPPSLYVRTKGEAEKGLENQLI